MVRKYTEKQWNEFPSEKKGRVTHEYRADGKRPTLIGYRTLHIGNRMLIEGVDFVIDYSLV